MYAQGEKVKLAVRLNELENVGGFCFFNVRGLHGCKICICKHMFVCLSVSVCVRLYMYVFTSVVCVHVCVCVCVCVRMGVG